MQSGYISLSFQPRNKTGSNWIKDVKVFFESNTKHLLRGCWQAFTTSSCSLACSSDCVLCDEVGRCRACRDQTYLMEGYCTPNCGHGYYADQKTRTCHGENTASGLCQRIYQSSTHRSRQYWTRQLITRRLNQESHIKVSLPKKSTHQVARQQLC